MGESAHTIRLLPDDALFTVEPGETVLNAALRSGIPLKYGCRHGNCSSCKYRVLEGEVDYGMASPYSLSEGEREAGWALLCCAVPLSDLELQDSVIPDRRRLPVLAPAEIEATVAECTTLGGDLWTLVLRLDFPLDFYAGQFVEVEVPGSPGSWRSYSIASAPAESQIVELIVKRIPGGRFSGRIHEISPGTRMRVRGPYGTGYLRSGHDPVLLVATGAGIAPIMSILRHAATHRDERRFSLFYGARTRAELVMLPAIQALAESLDLAVVPVLSRATDACEWQGAVGRVTTAIQRWVDDAHQLDAYVCGKAEMCDSVALLLDAKGIREGHFHADRFFPAVESLEVAT